MHEALTSCDGQLELSSSILQNPLQQKTNICHFHAHGMTFIQEMLKRFLEVLFTYKVTCNIESGTYIFAMEL